MVSFGRSREITSWRSGCLKERLRDAAFGLVDTLSSAIQVGIVRGGSMHATHLLALTTLVATTYAATPGSKEPWRDASPHRLLRVQVTADVQLEILDWGGTG